MKRTNQIAKSVLVAGIMAMMLTSFGAQAAGTNHSQPHFSGQAPGEVQAILCMFKGSVTAVNAKTKTLTIKSGKEDHSFKVTAKTKFKEGDKSVSFKAVGVGKTVEVIVNIRAKSDEAITITINDK